MSKYEKAIERAKEVASQGPKEYRETIFAEVLRHELIGTQVEQRSQGRTRRMRVGDAGSGELQPIEAHIVAEEGNRQVQAVWAVMDLDREGEVADNEAIRRRIKDKLSISPQSRQDTNRTLRKLVPKYLTREEKEEGRGYRYFPGPSAVEIFTNLENHDD